MNIFKKISASINEAERRLPMVPEKAVEEMVIFSVEVGEENYAFKLVLSGGYEQIANCWITGGSTAYCGCCNTEMERIPAEIKMEFGSSWNRYSASMENIERCLYGGADVWFNKCVRVPDGYPDTLMSFFPWVPAGTWIEKSLVFWRELQDKKTHLQDERKRSALLMALLKMEE